MLEKTALITGASRGLGLALAQALAERGWALIIDSRGAEALENARSELSRRTRVVAIQGDVSDENHRDALVGAARDLNGLDLLVNNASILGPSPQPVLLEYPLDILEQVYRVNVISPLALIQAMRRDLKPDARIMNITSDAALQPYEGWGGYGSSKAALEQLSNILAVENPGWRVYWVDPGDMRTQMQQEAFPGEDISDRPIPEESVPGLMELVEGDLPSGRYQARDLHSGSTKDSHPSPSLTSELRVALTVPDPDLVADLFGEGLGLTILDEWVSPEGRGILLNAGTATLELLDPRHAEMIDRVETGVHRSGLIRLAFEVKDVEEAASRLETAGGEWVHGPVQTPWGDRNVRLQTPDGLQITLFETSGKTLPEEDG